MGNKYGYGRVSSLEQNLSSQIQLLKEAGVSTIYQDKKTGKNNNREGLQELLSILAPGDTVVITKLDRIARNVTEGIKLIDDLVERGIQLHVLNMGLFDGSATSKLLRNILLSVAQWEREMILERQKEGIAIAKMNGKYKGKPRKYTDSNVALMHALELFQNRSTNGKTVKEICDITKVGRATLYNIAKEKGMT